MSRHRAVKRWALMLLAPLSLVPATLQAQQLERQGEISFVTGGIGLGERETLASLAEREGLNVKVAFAEASGPYLSEVAVTVHTASGNTILETTTRGPWLVARLPAGEYRVRARAGSTVREGTIVVPSAGRVERVFAFPDSDVDPRSVRTGEGI